MFEKRFVFIQVSCDFMQVYSISLLVKIHMKPWMFMHTRIFVNIVNEMKRDLSRDEYRY